MFKPQVRLLVYLHTVQINIANNEAYVTAFAMSRLA